MLYWLSDKVNKVSSFSSDWKNTQKLIRSLFYIWNTKKYECDSVWRDVSIANPSPPKKDRLNQVLVGLVRRIEERQSIIL